MQTEDVVSEGYCLATISQTSKEGVGMKTDQTVAHGHTVIKQPLAYMGKSEPSLLLTLTIDAHPLIFSFFCHI